MSERTGYSLPVVEYAIDRLFESITDDALTATIAGELGSIEILDGFVSRPGRTAAWAAPAGKICIISSRTTIGVALPPAMFALCAGCDVLVKDREDSLVAAFFSTLHEESATLRAHARAESWSSTDETARDLASFDAVVVFGRDETLNAVRQSLRADARFIGFGPRASAGYISRDDLENMESVRVIADGAARDIVLYETEGCLSLHVLFVEAGGRISPSEFETLLQRAIATAGIEFPAGQIAQTTLACVAQAQALAAFRTSAKGSRTLAEPPAFLPRVPTVIPVDNPSEALHYLHRHGLALEGFALAQERGDLHELALNSGAVWIAPFGTLQNPPLSGNHGGRARIADFVKWIDKTI